MTGAAPAWVSYAALGISAIAAIVSFLGYRASGPRIHLKVQYVGQDAATRRVVATFTVVNKGRGDTSIVGFHVTPYGERNPVVEVENDKVDGPTLPHRMEGNSQETWSANILPAARWYRQG